MPRLEDGELLSSASKFKKRRAWILPDDSDLAVKTIAAKSLPTAKPLVEEPLIITRVEHEYNKSITRVEQKTPDKSQEKPEQKPRSEQERNKTKARVEHDYNKSVTRIEHDYNNTKTKNEHESDEGNESFELGKFFYFIEKERASIIHHEDDTRSLILSLSDVQKRTFWHIAIECINRKAPRTGPIEIKSFFAKLLISTAVVRTTLNRLVDKRIIQREKGKLGKNGFAIISLPKTMFDGAQEIYSSFKAGK